MVVLDYGSGNLRSAERALVRAGAQVTVSASPELAVAADGLVVPGVGAFAACVAGVRAVGGDEAVLARVAAGRPVLGICVGMQVLFESGDEFGTVSPGLGVLPGTVSRLSAPVLPHIGWNTLDAPAGSVLLRGVERDRFYFVHSFAAASAPGLVGFCRYDAPFAATVEWGPVSATQFHPEKSSGAGGRLLANWVGSLRGAA